MASPEQNISLSDLSSKALDMGSWTGAFAACYRGRNNVMVQSSQIKRMREFLDAFSGDVAIKLMSIWLNNQVSRGVVPDAVAKRIIEDLQSLYSRVRDGNINVLEYILRVYITALDYAFGAVSNHRRRYNVCQEVFRTRYGDSVELAAIIASAYF